MKKAVLALMLLWAAPLFADPPRVPEPVKANVGDDIQIEVTVEAGKKGAYAPGFDVADCLFFRGYSEDETVMRFLVRPKKAQKFVTVFWTVGEAKYSTLVIDAAPVAPPAPPVPPVPPPADNPLLGPVRDAYGLEAAADREKATGLAAAMRQAAAWAGDPAFSTNGQLVLRVKADTNARIAQALSKVRAVIGTHLNATLPGDDMPLTDALRARYRAAYTQAALAVEALR